MYKYKVRGSYTIWIRSDYGGGSKLGLLKGGDTFDVREVRGNWVNHNKLGKWAWSVKTQGSLVLMDMISSGTSTSTTVKNNTTTPTTTGDPYTPTDFAKYQNPSAVDPETDGFIKNTRGIHGLPYQFMSSVDRRVPGSIFGRKYAEKIVTAMPLLLLTPGRPKFMSTFSINQKKDILKYMMNKDQNYVDELIKGSGRYYTFEFNYDEYYKIVNPMAQMMARMLNIHDKKIDNTSLDRYSWQNFANSSFKSFVSSAESVAFYIDSETQISESFSNSTGESMLSGQTNSLSDTAREIQFLLGAGAGVEFEKLSAEAHESTLKQFDGFFGKYLKKIAPDKIINRLQSGLLTVATGGKLLFPEIWNDSSFSRSYSINIKLRSPESDNFSWFMNIGIPLIHLLALTAPQQMDANSYKAPFLIRGYYKGFFNCDMGIITGMNVNKGNSAKWTLNGLPTEVDVSLDLKDLYQLMMVTQAQEAGLLKGPLKLLNNTVLIDYLANMCGININKPDIMRTLDVFKVQVENTFVNKITFNKFLSVKQQLSNLINDVLRN